MKKLIILLAALILAFVLFWLLLLRGDSVPDGWTTYQDEEMGISLNHPETLEPRVFRLSPQNTPYWVFFAPSAPAFDEDEDLDDEEPIDTLWFSIYRFPLEGQALERLANERARAASVIVEEDLGQTVPQQAEPVVFAGLQGYRYFDHDELYDYAVLVPTVLIPASPTEYFVLSYAFSDLNNQGYEQTLQQMLASFQVL